MPTVPNMLILPNAPMAFSFGTLRYRSAVSHPDKPEDAIPNKTLSITNQNLHLVTCLVEVDGIITSDRNHFLLLRTHYFFKVESNDDSRERSNIPLVISLIWKLILEMEFGSILY